MGYLLYARQRILHYSPHGEFFSIRPRRGGFFSMRASAFFSLFYTRFRSQ